MHTNKTQKNKSIFCVFAIFLDTFFQQQQQQKKSYIKMTTVHP